VSTINGSEDIHIVGVLEENVLSALVWHPDMAPILVTRITPDIFSTRNHQKIAKAAFDYIERYKLPPRHHIKDAFEAELRRGKKADAEWLVSLLDNLECLSETLQPNYVLDNLDGYIKSRMMQESILAASDLVTKGKADEARQHLWAALNCSPPPSTLPDPWSDPVPPPFKIDLLPSTLKGFVEDRAKTTGFDPAGIAGAAISACSAAIPGSVRLQMKEHDASFQVPPSFWVLLVGMSGEGKSPILKMAWDPLKKLDKEINADWRTKMAEWRKRGKEDGDEEPVRLRLVAENATIEGLQNNILSKQNRGIGVPYDEFAGLLGSMDKYSAGKGSMLDRAFYLVAFDGGTYSVDRATKSLYIENNLITLCSTIQLAKLQQLGDLTSDGLQQRMAPILLQEQVKGSDRSSGREVARYETLIEHLVNEVQGNRTVTMSPAALEAREYIEDEARKWRKNNMLGEGFQTFAKKLPSIFGRLALTFAHIDDYHPNVITEEVALDAGELVLKHLMPHAARFYSASGGGSNIMLTRKIAGWLLTKRLPRVLPRDLMSGVRECRNMSQEDVRKALSPLVAMGWLIPEDERNPNTRKWQVAHAVYNGQFDDRAQLEILHRTEARELIMVTAEERRKARHASNADNAA
jgi:hypothetical protein